MSRYVVDLSVILHMLTEGIEIPDDHELLAPTLLRSQVLDELYRAVEGGEMTEEVGREHLQDFARMKLRYLGDKVLRQQAWKVADQLGLDSTSDAEYIALTQLQADAFVTTDSELRKIASSVVATEPIDHLW